jgi:hypothetical protein
VIGLLVMPGFAAFAVAIGRWTFCRRVNPAEFQHRDPLEIALTKRLG